MTTGTVFRGARTNPRRKTSNSNCPNGTAAKIHLFAGGEYLFGERETLNGNFGTDQRLMFEVGISK